MPKKVFYWQSAVCENAAEFEGCQKQISALLKGDYRTAGLDTKKLRGYKLFTARINDADRLLFTTIEIQGQAHLLLLEVIKNHDYQKSKYLNNPSQIKKFLEQQAAALQSITGDFFEEPQTALFEKEDKESKSDGAVDYQPASYYQNRFIVLNDEQKAVQNAQLPLIVSGPPGSGKSCVAIDLLKKQLKKREPGNQKPLLYLAKSAFLVRHMEKLWHEEKMDAGHTVRFLTYEELIAENLPADQQYAAYPHFLTWYDGLAQGQKGPLLSFSPDILYQEMQICAALTKKHYLEIGKKNSLLAKGKQETMEKLFALNERYQELLVHQKLVNLDFFKPKAHAAYHTIVVDESQDLTPTQLQNVFGMAAQENIVYCLDTHQSLLASKSILPFVENLTHKNHIKLPFSYRCGQNILQMANGLIALKNNLVGGTAVKNELREIDIPADQPRGSVHWLSASEKPTPDLDKFKAEYKETEVAIVVWPEHLEEARLRFKTPLIFTPAQIKGLEYKMVVAYRLFDQDIYKQANKRLQESQLKEVKGRAKGEAEDRFGPPFNQLFTAATRAIEKLVFVQEKTYHNQRLLEHLQKQPQMEEKLSEVAKERVKEVSREEWLAQAKVLLGNGNEEQAKEIYLQKLEMSAEDFIAFKTAAAVRDAEPVKEEPSHLEASEDSSKEAKDSDPASKPSLPAEIPSTGKPLSKEMKDADLESKSGSQAELKSTNKPLSKTVVKYAEKLFKHLTDANLNSFFEEASPKTLNAVLFKIPLLNEKISCLFYRFISSPRETQRFNKLFEQYPQRINDLDPALLGAAIRLDFTEPLFLLLHFPGTPATLSILLKVNPKLASFLTLRQLVAEHDLKEGKRISLLKFLFASKPEILALLIDSNPELARGIRYRDLVEPSDMYIGSGITGDLIRYSFEATLFKDPHKIWPKLLTVNPNLIDEIPDYRLRGMASFDDIRTVLIHLATNNPRLATILKTAAPSEISKIEASASAASSSQTRVVRALQKTLAELSDKGAINETPGREVPALPVASQTGALPKEEKGVTGHTPPTEAALKYAETLFKNLTLENVKQLFETANPKLLNEVFFRIPMLRMKERNSLCRALKDQEFISLFSQYTDRIADLDKELLLNAVRHPLCFTRLPFLLRKSPKLAASLTIRYLTDRPQRDELSIDPTVDNLSFIDFLFIFNEHIEILLDFNPELIRAIRYQDIIRVNAFCPRDFSYSLKRAEKIWPQFLTIHPKFIDELSDEELSLMAEIPDIEKVLIKIAAANPRLEAFLKGVALKRLSSLSFTTSITRNLGTIFSKLPHFSGQPSQAEPEKKDDVSQTSASPKEEKGVVDHAPPTAAALKHAEYLFNELTPANLTYFFMTASPQMLNDVLFKIAWNFPKGKGTLFRHIAIDMENGPHLFRQHANRVADFDKNLLTRALRRPICSSLFPFFLRVNPKLAASLTIQDLTEREPSKLDFDSFGNFSLIDCMFEYSSNLEVLLGLNPELLRAVRYKDIIRVGEFFPRNFSDALRAAPKFWPSFLTINPQFIYEVPLDELGMMMEFPDIEKVMTKSAATNPRLEPFLNMAAALKRLPSVAAGAIQDTVSMLPNFSEQPSQAGPEKKDDVSPKPLELVRRC